MFLCAALRADGFGDLDVQLAPGQWDFHSNVRVQEALPCFTGLEMDDSCIPALMHLLKVINRRQDFTNPWTRRTPLPPSFFYIVDSLVLMCL